MLRKLYLVNFIIILLLGSRYSAFARPYYVVNSNPWGDTSDILAMNNVYGAGFWTQANYSTPAATIFSVSTNFVMLEGSDQNALALSSFLTANQSLIEAWVYQGGKLFINSAPNQGGNIPCGFGGTVIEYPPAYATTAEAVDTTDTIFHGPYLPVPTTFNGTYVSHAFITGVGLDSILMATQGFGVHPILTNKTWGNGSVYFGTLTQPDWWQPQPDAQNLWFNIIFMAASPLPPNATGVLDSFSVTVTRDCGGAQFVTRTINCYPGLYVKTYYGDTQIDSNAVNPAPNGGSASFNHVYNTSGTYSIKQVLYNGAGVVDSLQFSYQYQLCNVLFISNYYDLNNNCVKDSTEPDILQGVLIAIDSNNVPIDTISCMSGMYYFANGGSGDVYSFKAIFNEGFYTSCPAIGILYDTLQVAGNNPKDLNFGMSCTAGTSLDLAGDYDIPITGTIDQLGNIYVRNNYCFATNAVVTLYFSPKYVYNGTASPSPSAVSGNSLTWNLANLSAADIDPVVLNFQVWNSPVTGPLTIGDTVQEHIYITPTNGDTDIANNTMIIYDTVKSGCDPNHITVKPEGHIAAGTNLTYKIEFENTGNDTAHNIYVLDTLPNEVDLNSMRMITSTNRVYVTRLTAGNHKLLKFDFPGINLLDSSHHNACTGTFSYTINSKSGLLDGTLIDHRAGIYFDYNGVVMTNTVENIIGFPTNVNNLTSESKVQLCPNPVTDQLTIKTTEGRYNSLTITNAMGQVMMRQDIGGTTIRVSTAMLDAGVYYIELMGANGTETRKFVKL